MRRTLQLVGYQRQSYWNAVNENISIFVHIVGFFGVLWVGGLLIEFLGR